MTVFDGLLGVIPQQLRYAPIETNSEPASGPLKEAVRKFNLVPAPTPQS